jgi:ABC-type microcin C transport system permease subunit YejB
VIEVVAVLAFAIIASGMLIVLGAEPSLVWRIVLILCFAGLVLLGVSQ